MRLTRLAGLSSFLAIWAFPALLAAQTKTFHETVPLDAGGRLQLEGSKGSITLTGWDRDEVEIDVRIEAPKGVSDDYAERAVEAAKVDVRSSAGSVRVRSDYSDVPRRGTWVKDLPYIHYEIRAPRRLQLTVESDRGRADITGFEGEIRLDADRGRVDLRDLAGELKIALDRAGNSTMSAIRGSIELEADRTDVRMEDVRIEEDSRLELDRSDVSIDLEPSQALTLRADLTRRSSFDSELPLTVSSKSGNDFSGTINGGGPRLDIESDRGEVRLNSVR